MKLSFTTNGWNNLSFDECLLLAEEFHFQGIELYDPLRPEFSARTRRWGAAAARARCMRFRSGR